MSLRASGREVAHVGRGVGQHLVGQRPAGPVLALVFLVHGDAEDVAQHRLEAGLFVPQETAGGLGVEEVVDADLEVAVERAHVVVGPMEHFAAVGIPEDRLERGEVAHGQGVDDGVAFAAGNLQQAHLFLKVVHGVGFEVDADDGFPPQGVRQAVELGRGVDDVVAKRSVRRHFLLDPLSPFS